MMMAKDKRHICHGLCLVTFFLKNNHRTAPTESPMMATSPLFSATFTTRAARRAVMVDGHELTGR